MGKGSSPSSSGVDQSFASVIAAQQAYALGQQQLDWAKQVWQQEQPLVNQAMQSQIGYAQQQAAESAAQWNLYQQYYAPLQKQVATEVQDWASPQAMTLARGQAQANVAEQVASGVNAAKETLGNYGVNAGSPELAGLYVGANTVGAAAEAAAGTSAAEQRRVQQLALEQQAAGQGQNVALSSGSLGQQGAQAASGSASTAQQNLATGSSAFTAPVNWFNTGATNMGVYTNAVNQFNQQQYQQAALNAQVLGQGIQGIGDFLGFLHAEKGGAVPQYQEGGPTGIPTPPGGTPGGFVPYESSPSQGQVPDDVNSLLTAGEFVIPKDVVDVKGTDFFYKLIDQTRKVSDNNSQRKDIGGEMAEGLPSGPPAFVSRPQQPQPPAPASPQNAPPIPMPLGLPSGPRANYG